MLTAQRTIEDETQELLRLAHGILAILSAENPRGFMREQRAMAQAAVLRAQWRVHLTSLAQAAVWIRGKDEHFTAFLDRFEFEAAFALKRLERAQEEGKPHGNLRGAQLKEAIAETLRVVTTEQATVIPLLRRWSSTRVADAPFRPILSSGVSQSGSILPC